MKYLFIPGSKGIFTKYQLETGNYCLPKKVDTMD
jgi:hypothetical protein